MEDNVNPYEVEGESEEVTARPNKVGRIALKLFAFLQRCRINVKAEPTPAGILSFDFTVADMTDEGVPFGLAFKLTARDVEDVPDDDTAIEAYCFNYVINIGQSLLMERVTRLLEYNKPEAKSRIILP